MKQQKETESTLVGLSILEASANCQEIEGEQAEAEERAAESEQEQAEVESFSQSTTQVLDDLDAGDLANAVNLAVDGQLDDSNIANRRCQL